MTSRADAEPDSPLTLAEACETVNTSKLGGKMIDNGDIILAIRWHMKALRLLGSNGTTILDIAHALKLDQKQVSDALANHRVPMAYVDSMKSRSFTVMKTEFSPFVGFRKQRQKSTT